MAKDKAQNYDLLPVPEKIVLDACSDETVPEMAVMKQRWETNHISKEKITDQAAEQIERLKFSHVSKGDEVAIGVGSRGIANISGIVVGIINCLREQGYHPFVFPAMGSHGGATVNGQIKMLESLGVTEETVGCEIRATMDTVVLGETSNRGVAVHADAHAAGADAIIPVNRVKAHTDFHGSVESGLSKMLVIGMGKQRGAKTAHKWAADWSFRKMLPELTDFILEKLPVAGGVAIVEDEYHNTIVLEGVPPSDFLNREAELLETAYERMPTIPFDNLDVLVVDEMGKDVSGTGMDTNVIGRMVYGNEPAPESPDITRIFVRDLTMASHGNATALGSADMIHADLFEEMNYTDTFVNMLTASTLKGVRIPAPVETDRAGLVACLSTIGVTPGEEARVVRIRNTMDLEYIKISSVLVDEAEERDDLRVIADPKPVEFDENGQYEVALLDV